MTTDHERYALTPEQAEAVRNLTPGQLEYAYRIREWQYRMQDAKDHAEEVLEDDPDALGRLDDSDYEELAFRFLDEADCNVPENETWENVIRAYID